MLEKTCKHCGDLFQARSKTQVYCPEYNCSSEAVLAKQRELQFNGKYAIHERDGFRCFYCRRSSIEDKVELHLDHVIPRAQGGEDHKSNIVTACSSCNSTKGCRVPSENNLKRILAEIARRNKVVIERNPVRKQKHYQNYIDWLNERYNSEDED